MICPPEYVPLHHLFTFVEELQETELGDLQFLNRVAHGSIHRGGWFDEVRHFLTQYLNVDLFVTDGVSDVVRLDWHFWDARFMLFGRGQRESRIAFQESYPDIERDFFIGYDLRREVVDRFETDLAFRKKIVAEPVDFSTLNDRVVPDSVEPENLDAAELFAYYSQRAFQTPSLFWNFTRNTIDLRFFDAVVAFQSTTGAVFIDESCHVWADILRSKNGWYFCAPKELADNALIEKAFLEYCCDEPLADSEPKSMQMRRRGRKPSGAKEEYFRRYPNGKAGGITFEAIAAELSEAGFPISARSVQYYERERNKSEP